MRADIARAARDQDGRTIARQTGAHQSRARSVAEGRLLLNSR
jgi:hypothetical protein